MLYVYIELTASGAGSKGHTSRIYNSSLSLSLFSESKSIHTRDSPLHYFNIGLPILKTTIYTSYWIEQYRLSRTRYEVCSTWSQFSLSVSHHSVLGVWSLLKSELITLSRRRPKTVYVQSTICVRVCTAWHETHNPSPNAYPHTVTIFIQVYILIQDFRRCWDFRRWWDSHETKLLVWMLEWLVDWIS
jgi:hypothetical protein